MNNQNSIESQERELGTVSVKKLLAKYSSLAVIGILTQVVYIVFDGNFLGGATGEVGLAAYGVVYPLIVIAEAVGMLMAVGATTIAGIYLGAGENDKARRIFGVSVWYALIGGIIISVIFLAFKDSIVQLLGANTPELIKEAGKYLVVFFLGFPIMILGFVMYYFVRLDEQPMIGVAVMCLPAVAAIFVEYYCFYTLGMGVQVAAIGYCIAVGLWALAGLYFVFSKKTIFKCKLSDLLGFKEFLNSVKDIFRVGFSSFMIQISYAILSIMISNLLSIYGDTMDKAAWGIISGYLLNVMIIVVNLGFAVGMQPIVSFNFGAKKFNRVREALTTSIVVALITIAALTAAIFLFPDFCIGSFAGHDAATVNATVAAKWCMLLYALGGTSSLISGYFQATEQPIKAVFNGCMRNIIIGMPALLIFSKLWGVGGIWYGVAVADICSFLIAIIFIAKELKLMNKR